MALETFKRFFQFRDAKVADTGAIDLVMSTNERVDFGSFGEILSHERDAVDTSTCTALLLNHDPDQIAGRILNIGIAGGRSTSQTIIHADARAKSGPKVRDLVDDGTLGGISISYQYDSAKDASYDEKTRTLSVRRWRMLEASLTPIPRDKNAYVARSLPANFAAQAAGNSPTNTETPMVLTLARLLELQKANPEHSIAIGERAVAGDDEAKIIAWLDAEKARAVAARDETERSREIATLRKERQINLLAESHGVSGAKYRSMETIEKAIEAILKDKADTVAASHRGFAPGGREGVSATVTNDEGDKFIAAASDAMFSRSGVIAKRGHVKSILEQKRGENLNLIHVDGEKSRNYSELGLPDLGARNMRYLDIVRRCAALSGMAGARDWDDYQAADFAMRASNIGWAQQYHKRGANETFSMFGGILANVMDKTIIMGFNGFENVTYDEWCRTRQVMDFKQFSAAALTLGNLVSTVENQAFPELTAKDSSYSGTLAMWGGTLTLTLQALLSDDLGEFFSKLGQAGSIARRTMDREVYNQLMGISYGALDLVTGAPLGTQDNLDKVRTLFRQKLNPAGQKMGNSPEFLLHPFGLTRAAQQATGRARPPGEQSYLASDEGRSIKEIECPYLDDASVNANASTTSYYLVGGPTVDTIVAATLSGMQTPQVMEFDAGATAARKFKIMMPFVAVPATYTDNVPNTGRLVGITKGTP